jgi:hypothetical protein
VENGAAENFDYPARQFHQRGARDELRNFVQANSQ